MSGETDCNSHNRILLLNKTELHNNTMQYKIKRNTQTTDIGNHMDESQNHSVELEKPEYIRVPKSTYCSHGKFGTGKISLL